MKSRTLPVLLLIIALAGCAPTARMTEPASRPAADEAAAPPAVASAEELPQDWYHLDVTENRFPGISTEKTYRTLLSDKQPRKTVTVAVIDSGVDIEHEDLQGRIWTNEDEIPNNRLDDDGNGYVDDVHGWNFIGGPDGRNVDHDSYEITREYARLQARFGDTPASQVPSADREAYDYYQRIKAAYEARVQELRAQYMNTRGAYEAVQQATRLIREHLKTDTFTDEQLAQIQSPREDLQSAKGILLYIREQGFTLEMIAEQMEYLQNMLEYGMNPEFDPRPIVGDNYEDVTERFYGNNDVIGPDPKHGTHVAGIIAANRENEIGAEGIAGNVRIMVLRAVPNGDERDKDVANAIRYAVENGADIINMSFGKSYSPQKEAVDAAVRYAEEQGVLLVHGAGNDGKDLDVSDSYPSRAYLSGEQARNWIEVGASSWEPGDGLAASFSNYGRQSVDVFAPGVDIYSTIPASAYASMDGTSMASPVVAGLAALLMSYYPDLTADQIRTIILQSAVKVPAQVTRPGDGSARVDFAQLSSTGGIVNSYEAVRMAEAMSK